MSRPGHASASSARFTGTGTVRAVVIVALVVLIVLFALFAARDHRQTFRDAALRADNLALLLAEHAGRLFETGDYVIGQAVRMAGDADEPLPSGREAFRELRALLPTTPFLVSIWIGDETGAAVLTTHEFPAPDLIAHDREYFKVARDRPDALYIGPLPDHRYDPATPLVSMSRRVEPIDGAFRGFVQVGLDATYLARFYEAIDIGYDVVVWLVDSELRPMQRWPSPGGEVLSELAAAEYFEPIVAGAARGGFVEAEGIRTGTPILFAHEALQDYEVHVLVGIERASILARWRERVAAYGWFTLAGLGAIVAIGGIAQRAARREQAAGRELERRVEERTHELTRALDERELLFNELHHRVNNSLQLVLSLLRIEGPNADERSRVDEAYRRVLTIVQLHNRLADAATVDEVAFDVFLRDLCADLEAALQPADGRLLIDRDVEAAVLPTSMAVSLGLVVNELVTNAVKYAAGADGDVRVRVRLRLRPPGRMELVVEDDGPGLSTPVPSAGGSGLRLVRGLVEQLDGELDIEQKAPGTRFVVALRSPGARATGTRAAA